MSRSEFRPVRATMSFDPPLATADLSLGTVGASDLSAIPLLRRGA
jgi:hypothetical protein